MNLGGGEVLRAVMQASCVYSNFTLACVTLNADDGTMNATGTQRAFLQVHKDRWFMVTAMVPTVTQSPGFSRMNANEVIRFFDPSNDTDFSFKPEQFVGSLFADTTMNNPFTLPEYILWSPGSLIGVEWTGINFNAEVGFKFLTLIGVEYGMKD